MTEHITLWFVMEISPTFTSKTYVYVMTTRMMITVLMTTTTTMTGMMILIVMIMMTIATTTTWRRIVAMIMTMTTKATTTTPLTLNMIPLIIYSRLDLFKLQPSVCSWMMLKMLLTTHHRNWRTTSTKMVSYIYICLSSFSLYLNNLEIPCYIS